jgi:hypothetical protein
LTGVTTSDIQLCASSPADPRARRAVDVLQAAAYLLLVLLAGVLSVIARDLDTGLSTVLTSFPGFLEALWTVGFWAGVAWALALLVMAVLRRRFGLALAGLVAAVVGVAIADLVAAIASGDTPSTSSGASSTPTVRPCSRPGHSSSPAR